LFGFGGGRRSQRRTNQPMQGAHLHTAVRITFEQSVFGCEKELELTLKDPCETCNGTGAKPGTSPETCPNCNGQGQVVMTQQSLFGMIRNVQTCSHCNGTGKIVKEKCSDCYGSGYIARKKKVAVGIPAGIQDGQSVRIRGKGEPGVNGGPRGDLLVEVRVSSHPIFQRNGWDLYSSAPISFADAALGGEVEIDTIDGKVMYDVKPGTQTDTRVRLRGKGVPTSRNKDVRGDHYVTLIVQVPEKLTSEQKDLLRAFDESMGGKHKPKKESKIFKKK